MRKREGVGDRKKDDLFLSRGNYGRAYSADRIFGHQAEKRKGVMNQYY